MTTQETVRRFVVVLWSLLKYRARVFLLVGALFCLISVVVLGISTVRSALETAQRTSVLADVGGQPFSVQAGTDEARKAIEGEPSLVPVLDTDGYLATKTARNPSGVRAIDRSKLRLGTIVEGRAPSQAGEASVSRELALNSDLKVGEFASVEREGRKDLSVKVVGITVDPAEVTDTTTVIVDPTVSSTNATLWLSGVDPYTLPNLRDLMDKRSITYRPTESMLATAADVPPVGSASLRAVQWGLGMLLAIVIVGVCLLLLPAGRRTVRALVGAGMSPRQAWRLIGASWFLAALTGLASGFAIALLVLRSVQRPLSATFGQYWLGVPAPLVPTVVLVSLTGGALLVARPISIGVAKFLGQLRKVRVGWALGLSVSGALVACGALMVAAGFVASRQDNPPTSMSALPLPGAIAIILGIPALLSWAGSETRYPSLADVAAQFHGGGMRAAVVGSVVVLLWSGSHAAASTHNANAFETISKAPQPAGSLLVTEVPADAAEAIVSRYRALGGSNARQYELPDEREFQLRVTGPSLVACLERSGTTDPETVDADCFPQETNSPVATVALSPAGTEAVADSGLVEKAKVGLLLFPTGSPAARTLAVTDASADNALGGNLPGLVVPVDGPVAERFGLKPSGTVMLGLLDFGDLPGPDRARLRSLVSQVAPAAQVAESTDVGAYDAERAQARGVAWIGAALASLVLLAGGLGVVVGQRRTRRILADLGASARRRNSLAYRWALVPAATAAVGGALAWITAESTGTSIEGSAGWYWLVPTVSVLVCCAVLYLAMLRVPPTGGD